MPEFQQTQLPRFHADLFPIQTERLYRLAEGVIPF